jgi:histidine triad (HIT) family protein
METIFTKIIKGEIPCAKIYEDDQVFAFLDINPINPGHTLVIPKEPYENICEIPNEILEKMIVIAKQIAIKQKEVLNADGINIGMNNGKDAGQEVFHAHIHVIPRYKNDRYKLWHGKVYESEEQKIEIQEKLKF